MTLRWCAAGMLEAAKQFRRVNGVLHLPALRDAANRHVALSDWTPQTWSPYENRRGMEVDDLITRS